MEEHVPRFVSTADKPALPAPMSDTGFLGHVRKNLFATPLDSVLSIMAALFIVWAGWNLVNWALIDAVFTGDDRTACLVEGGGHGGACWAFVRAKFGQFMYGVYPLGERWRVDVCFALVTVLTAALLIPKVPYKGITAVLLFAVFPIVALVLLTGGRFGLGGGAVALVLLIAAALTVSGVGSRPEVSTKRIEMRLAVWLAIAALAAILLSNIVSARQVTFLDFRFTPLALFALLAAVASIGLAIVTAMRTGATDLLKVATPAIAAVLLLFAIMTDFGLRPVPTRLWGGLMLTLVVALTGIAASLPLGVVLALGRRSQMPAVKLVCVIFIEFWRGVPLITVLFMATFVLPLLMPEGVNFNQLLRALVGVALFSAAYMAEVIRGGLQAIPKGQYEGADAMALTYWQKMRLIILPQALKMVIPGIVNTFIGLFKDTSLVYIIGLADLLGTVRRGFSDPNWITPSTPATGLAFAAFIFWIFCFSMSRYSISMERRLDTGHKQ